MAQFGKSDKVADAPVYDVNSKGESGTDQFGNTVFGLSVTEAKLIPNAAPGWVRIVAGTGGRAGRNFVENLVVVRRFAADDPTNTAAPILSGAPQQGVAKSVGTPATWSSVPNSVTNRWYINATNSNSGGTQVATTTTYTPSAGDVGKYLYVVQVAVYTDGPTVLSAPSNAVGAITGA